MSPEILYLFAAASIFGAAVYGLLISRHLMRKLFALNIMASSVFLMIVTLGGRIGGDPDPVAQALVLTGIVVAVSSTAFALALMVRLYRETGEIDVSATADDTDPHGETADGG